MRYEIRAYVWKMLGYGLVLEALLAAAILFWPNFEENIGALRGMIPIDMGQKMFDQISRGGVAAYVNLQHFFKGCNALGTAAAVLFAMNAVAGEAHRGTMEIWLARPLSRRRILLERWVLGALALILPVFATTATIPWLLSYVEEEMRWDALMLSAVHQSILLLTVYSVTFLYSCLSSRPWQIAFAMLGLLVFEFALYMVKTATHWSIFRLADMDSYAQIGAAHALDWAVCGPMLALTAVLIALSLVAFSRRTP